MLKTGVSIQANKLDLPTSYEATLYGNMHYCEYYCNRHHHSFVVKTQSEIYIKQGSLLVQQKSSEDCVTLESLQILQLPPPLKWCSNMCPSFLSGSVQFCLFPLLFFVSLIISSLWRGQWWGIFRLCCCCLFSTIVYSLGLNVSDQVRAGTVPARGRGTSQFPLHDGGGLRMHLSDWYFSSAVIGCVELGAVDSCKWN